MKAPPHTADDLDDLDESDEDMTDVAEELRWQEFDAQLQEDRHNANR